jgi:hypothetical protein
MKNNKEIDIPSVKKALDAAEAAIRSARAMLGGKTANKTTPTPEPDNGTVVEGVFDGQNMIAPDGKSYPVPANYASKSKLVAGDILKLVISPDGSFIFKQIGPVERKKIVGILAKEGNDYTVVANGKTYKVLKASITYYKAEPGDEVAIIVPASEETEWAAVDNVVTVKPEK